MIIKLLIAILLGKIIHFTSRVFKISGGSAAPGYYALKIYPGLVFDLARQIPQTIIITGTNGKTTTARMLAQFTKEANLKVIRNATGSNLERGIASTLIQHSCLHLEGVRLDFNLAIWEVDEAVFNSVAPKIKAQSIVFLNVFRDQLDRYGEVDSIVKKWCQTLSKISPKTQIFINGDDHNLIQLKDCFKGKVQTFGLETDKIPGEKTISKNKTQKLDFEATNIQPRGFDKIDFTVNSQSFSLPVPGTYHVYNFLAAYILAKELNIADQDIIQALDGFLPAFGRVERFSLPPQGCTAKINNNMGYIFLIKNPVGATQVLQTLAPEIKPNDRLLLALNDNLADGRDVSWIWDSEWEKLQATGYSGQIACSGTRAEDMALRLKYAGIDPKKIAIENNLERAFEQARINLKGRLFILPTYTALLSLQKILASKGLKKHYWKEI